MALQASQPPPGEGWVTVGEAECRFLARRAGEEDSYPDRGLLYPDIYMDADTSLVSALEDHTHHFLPITENWMKRTLNIWRYRGSWSAIEDLAGNQDISGSIVGKTAGQVLSLLQWGRRVCGWFAPHRSKMSVYELTVEYSEVADWEDSPVHAMALHPRLPFIALARTDDAIEIKSLAQLQEQGLVLKDKDQKLVCCLKWAPHCSTLLAAGTSTGVLLWNVDPSVTTSRFLTSWVRVESSPKHSPVSSISWSPHGNFLISGSPADTNLIVWDIPMGVATRVRRTEGEGVNLVAVSPDGQRVFAASVGNVLRVWETEKWTCEKWTHFGGRCKAACWSPGGDFLLFALEGDHALYYLGFHGNSTSAGPVSAVKCSDLSPCVHVVNGQEVIVGGCVQTMSWDPTGERLAVIFTSDSPGSYLVAVLRTRLTTMLEILPGGFIRGEEGDRPQLVSFQRNCSYGAVMATAWVSGRVSFTPLHFTSTLHPSHLPTLTPELPPHLTHGPLPPQPQLFSTD